MRNTTSSLVGFLPGTRSTYSPGDDQTRAPLGLTTEDLALSETEDGASASAVLWVSLPLSDKVCAGSQADMMW